MTPDKITERTERLTVKLAGLTTLFHDTAAVAGQQSLSILADTERALKRAQKRAEAKALSAEWERVEIAQDKGPLVEFTGTLLGEEKWIGQRGLEHTIEIWNTKGGALVAVFSTVHAIDGFEACQVHVAEPDPSGEISQDQIFPIMDMLQWGDRARGLAKKLGWDLRQEVE